MNLTFMRPLPTYESIVAWLGGTQTCVNRDGVSFKPHTLRSRFPRLPLSPRVTGDADVLRRRLEREESLAAAFLASPEPFSPDDLRRVFVYEGSRLIFLGRAPRARRWKYLACDELNLARFCHFSEAQMLAIFGESPEEAATESAARVRDAQEADFARQWREHCPPELDHLRVGGPVRTAATDGGILVGWFNTARRYKVVVALPGKRKRDALQIRLFAVDHIVRWNGNRPARARR